MKRRLIHLTKKVLKKILGIGDHSQIEELKRKGLKVGKNFHMQPGCIIDYSHSWHIEIGDDVSLAPNVIILAHDASTWWYLEYTKVKNTRIGNRVFIGAGSIILAGTTIGNDVIIGAGSVVTKDVPDNSLVAGNPAKFIMKTDDYISKEKLKMNHENCFGREYSEANNVSVAQKAHIKNIADKYGTAFAE